MISLRVYRDDKVSVLYPNIPDPGFVAGLIDAVHGGTAAIFEVQSGDRESHVIDTAGVARVTVEVMP